MIKKYSLFLILFLFINSFIIASKISPDKLAEEIINKQLEIENFQVDIEMQIEAFSGQKSTFLFTYYYEEPDKIHLETKDFVLLPKEVLKTLKSDFLHLNKYNYKYMENKDSLYLYELIPLDNKEKYWIILYLDLEKKLIKAAEVFFYMDGYQEEFPAHIDFAEIDGYSLPVYLEGRLAVPTKFGMGGVVKELKEGSFKLKLRNYYINNDFSLKKGN